MSAPLQRPSTLNAHPHDDVWAVLKIDPARKTRTVLDTGFWLELLNAVGGPGLGEV